MPARRGPEETERLRNDLLQHARTLVEREGAQALTMRTLAAEADCAVGLPYKVFADRNEIITALITIELDTLSSELMNWLEQSAEFTVAQNLDRYASIVLGSHLTPLFQAVGGRAPDNLPDGGGGGDQNANDPGVASRTSTVVSSLDSVAADYLRLEQERGRIRGTVGADAFGFLVAGAVHNLVWAGDAYPRPSRPELTAVLAQVAAVLEPSP